MLKCFALIILCIVKCEKSKPNVIFILADDLGYGGNIHTVGFQILVKFLR